MTRNGMYTRARSTWGDRNHVCAESEYGRWVVKVEEGRVEFEPLPWVAVAGSGSQMLFSFKTCITYYNRRSPGISIRMSRIGKIAWSSNEEKLTYPSRKYSQSHINEFDIGT